MASAQSSCSLQPCLYSCVTSIGNENSCSKDDNSCQCSSAFQSIDLAASCMINCPSVDPEGIAGSMASFCGCATATAITDSDPVTLPNPITFPTQSTESRQATWKNLGPLTTTFTPPPDCGQLRGTQFGKPIWGGGCTAFPSARPGAGNKAPLAITLASSCYPSMFDRFATTTEPSAFYSPGLACPSGWGPVHYLPQTATGYESAIDSVVWSALKPGESMIVCCPDGYVGPAANLCISPFSPTSTVVMSSLHDSCVADLITSTVTATAAGLATAGALYLILPTNETFQQPLPWLGHQRELSVAEKIAVGIAVPLGTVLIVLLSLFWRKRYLRKLANSGQQRKGRLRKQLNNKQTLQAVHQQETTETGFYIKPELDATSTAAQVQPVTASLDMPILCATTHPSELYDVRDPQELATQHDPVELDSISVPIPPQSGVYSRH